MVLLWTVSHRFWSWMFSPKQVSLFWNWWRSKSFDLKLLSIIWVTVTHKWKQWQSEWPKCPGKGGKGEHRLGELMTTAQEKENKNVPQDRRGLASQMRDQENHDDNTSLSLGQHWKLTIRTERRYLWLHQREAWGKHILVSPNIADIFEIITIGKWRSKLTWAAMVMGYCC